MSKNNIIRVQKNKENPYVMLNKQCINDNRLTWAAKGLHTYLLSLPDDWTIYVNELTKHTSTGRDHTYTVIRELINYGYMQRFEYRHKGKVLGSSYVVYENPIEVGPLTKSMATIVKVDIDSEGNYIHIDENIENTTYEPNTENADSVKSDSVNTKLLNNNNNKLINKINNNSVDVVSKKETQLVDLYKSLKLEKRVMPHTTRLLKENTHIDLEVFEEVFIYLSSDHVKNKYKALREVIDKLNSKNITTLQQYEKDYKKYKESNTTKTTYAPKAKTRFHNVNNNIEKYKPEELENLLKENQKEKLYTSEEKLEPSNDSTANMTINELREFAVKNGWDKLSYENKKVILDHAKENNIFTPFNWTL